MIILKQNFKYIVTGMLVLFLGLLLAIVLSKNTDQDIDYESSEGYLKNYKINELIPVNMTEDQVARKYLAEYTKLLVQAPELAYELVEKEYRETKFGNINLFKEYFSEKYDSEFFNAKIKKISLQNIDDYKEIYIIDSSNNVFIFREYSINNYSVLFDNYTV